MGKIRVMIIEDSTSVRQFLEHIIAADPRLQVVASVESAEAGLATLPDACPDVISMDIHLPGMNGIEATRQIMEERPTPIVVVSGSTQARDRRSSMDALQSGALSVVEKPVGTTHRDFETLADRLCTQLAIMSQVKVVRQRFNRRIEHRSAQTMMSAERPAAGRESRQPTEMVGIVSSTGGPRALQTILSELPHDFPLPIVLVQHITEGFHQGFVEWLDQSCRLTVQTAKHRQQAIPGHIFVAPPDGHLSVEGRRLLREPTDADSGPCPSGTVLLESMASSLRDRAVGVVLTGMGDDGARGLLRIRQAGGYTLAESESTAVVYGMPAAAARLQAVNEQLPVHSIGPRLRSLALESVGVHQ